MPDEKIDLDKAIETAKKRFMELQELRRHPPADDPGEREIQRDKLMEILTEVNEQIVALEAIRDEKNASAVIVPDVTDAEVQEIRGALKDLDKEIRTTENFQAILNLATAALGSVRTIARSASGGKPASG